MWPLVQRTTRAARRRRSSEGFGTRGKTGSTSGSRTGTPACGTYSTRTKPSSAARRSPGEGQRLGRADVVGAPVGLERAPGDVRVGRVAGVGDPDVEAARVG